MDALTRVFVVANVLAAGVFGLFAAVQVNDPDPWLWIPVYLLPAVLALVAAAGKLPRWAPSIASAIAVLAAVPLLPAAVTAEPRAIVTDLRMHAPGVEEAREVLGLFIVASWMGFLGSAQRSGRSR